MNIMLEIKCQYEVLFSTFYEVIEYKRQNKNTDKILIWMQLHVILSSFVGILLGKMPLIWMQLHVILSSFVGILLGKNV